MFRRFVSLSLACLVLVAAAINAPDTRAQVKVPRINYRDRTLANGMRVISVEDHSTPAVAIHVWYHVGSKDDPEGRSGFAHLFEHIMFKATKNMKDEMFDRLTEDVGGFNNASTWDDYTSYYEVVPSNYLETLLWAEADRMASLVVNEATFKSERDVVKEEYRQNYLSSPYGRLFLYTDMRSFTTHPYRRPGIGNIDELNAATIEDVRAFHATYYRPDNATMIVVGDLDPKQFDAWVDKYFANIPKPEKAIPRVAVKEPQRTAEQRFVEHAPNVPLPAMSVTYLIPARSSDDSYALRVAEAILSGGESSRLYQSLVYQQQLLAEVGASTDLREDISLFRFLGILAGGKNLGDAEQALLAEVRKMQEKPVTKAELERAKNQLVTSQLLELETNDGKAGALGLAAVILGDPNRANTDIEKLQAVTAADIQRVMKKYLTDANRVMIHYLPEQAQGGDEE